MADSLLQQQIEYYRARAAEYDEWFYRQGRYDRGGELNQQWFNEVEIVRAALHELGSDTNINNVLEMACGTGIWTQELAAMFPHITALDASPEVIEINRAKLNATNVRYQQTDLFKWQPDAAYDLVHFSFWLSHVPPERLADFLNLVNRALRPGGHVFVIDSRREQTSTAHDQLLPEVEQAVLTQRRLNDGREYTIYKIFYEPEELEQHFAEAGFRAQAHVTGRYMIYAHAMKA